MTKKKLRETVQWFRDQATACRAEAGALEGEGYRRAHSVREHAMRDPRFERIIGLYDSKADRARGNADVLRENATRWEELAELLEREIFSPEKAAECFRAERLKMYQIRATAQQHAETLQVEKTAVQAQVVPRRHAAHRRLRQAEEELNAVAMQAPSWTKDAQRRVSHAEANAAMWDDVAEGLAR